MRLTYHTASKDVNLIFHLYLFCIPKPDPIGAARGITAEHPTSSNFLQTIGSSLQYGKTLKFFFHNA